MRPKPPWYPEAKRLHDEGMNANKVASVLGLNPSSVDYHLKERKASKSTYYAGVVERNAQYQQEIKERYGMTYQRLRRLRKEAQVEAAETNTPVLEIYRRWGILLKREEYDTTGANDSEAVSSGEHDNAVQRKRA